MKLLLTSSGLTTEPIRSALTELLGKPTSACRAVHVPTAVCGLPGGLGYATDMTRYWDDLGWAQLDTLELTTLPSLPDDVWRPPLEACNVILVAGGNSGYLSYWFHHTPFAALLPGLLDRAVYVGVSAGSCLLTPALNYDQQRLTATGVYYDDEYDEAAPPGAGDSRGLGLVDFQLRPTWTPPTSPTRPSRPWNRQRPRSTGRCTQSTTRPHSRSSTATSASSPPDGGTCSTGPTAERPST